MSEKLKFMQIREIKQLYGKMSNKKEAPNWEPLERNRITISAWSYDAGVE